jgi:spore germination protein YaaH
MFTRTFLKQEVSLVGKKKPSYKGLGWLSIYGLVGAILVILATLVTLWWFRDTPLASPINQLTSFHFTRHPIFRSNNKKMVYGFLPYWNTNDLQLHDRLTRLGYFGLTIGQNGKLLTVIDGETDPGYRTLQSNAFLEITNRVKANGGQIDLVLKQFNADDITIFLSSPKAQTNFFNSLESVLLGYEVTGINIDIELNGQATPKMRNDFTEFIKSLRSFLDKRFEDIELSIDVYASASKNNQLWDIPALAPYVDFFIVMAYDFHRSSSTQAGPVAPLLGGNQYWDSDINSNLKNFIEHVPKEKLVLGIPFYGYEWQTTSTDPSSNTFPDTGHAVVYSRIQELLSEDNPYQVTENWNEAALSPYLTYQEDGKTYILYYDDARSISYKLDYVNQLDLAGIAIWALGYEGENLELWEVIENKL